uniref:Regulatory factor X, 1a (influences HLA class II expression) n=1 Tax=Hucho hucho TaxID=62062 RepID=A0A4W5N1G2_9TELE
MTTTGYVGELQPVTTQPQGAAGGSVTVAGQSSASAAPHTVVGSTQQFLAELQTTVGAPAAAAGQTTPPAQATLTAAHKTAPPPQTQYVTAEIQGSSSQANNAQNTPQYIVVTVTEGSLHSSDSVSDSSPPPAVVQQTGVPTQVVQQVQAAQQRSVVQATSQITAKTEQGVTTQLSVTNLQPVHLTQEVQWLLDNYETAEGVSLPRSTLYCHYLLHCQEQKLEPVNAASFGKLIRSVFMGLRTRRLGTRGNSKYHYYGLRIKACSSLIRLMEDQQHLAMRQQPFSQKQRWLKPVQKVEGMTNGMAAGSGQQQQQQQGAGLSDISAQVQQYQQFLDASRTLPEFPDLDLQEKALPEGIDLEHIKSFQLLYREHCEVPVCMSHWLFICTVCYYVSVCLPLSVCLPVSPPLSLLSTGALTQAIRNFAKSLESWLTNAMMNIPEEMVRIKVTSASSFAQTLRRYTSLNHLAQAARAVLQNTAQINQMLSDLNRVDFANVQEQASWVCRCEDRVVQQLEQDFKLTLQQQNSLEQWAAWLDGVVSQVLKPYQASAAFPKAAKLFLLKWSFYSSMVIRDLTLRSAASFGSFHLIRLLYDEYMYYLIEHRVAQAKGETPIAVMGEFASLGRSLNPLDPDKEEEEEEEEESDDECQELSLPSDGAGLGEESLEPPTKLARTDQRGLFNTGQD